MHSQLERRGTSSRQGMARILSAQAPKSNGCTMFRAAWPCWQARRRERSGAGLARTAAVKALTNLASEALGTGEKALAEAPAPGHVAQP